MVLMQAWWPVDFQQNLLLQQCSAQRGKQLQQREKQLQQQGKQRGKQLQQRGKQREKQLQQRGKQLQQRGKQQVAAAKRDCSRHSRHTCPVAGKFSPAGHAGAIEILGAPTAGAADCMTPGVLTTSDLLDCNDIMPGA